MTTKTTNAANVEDLKLVSLSDLCDELKIKPREARMMLRLAVSKKGEYPALTEAHVPRQPWQWAKGSKALSEAKKALTVHKSA